jgi:hypothetical protein
VLDDDRTDGTLIMVGLLLIGDLLSLGGAALFVAWLLLR